MTFHGVADEGAATGARVRVGSLVHPFVRVFEATAKLSHVVDFVVKRLASLKGLKAKGNKMKSFKYFYYYYRPKANARL